MGRPKRSEQGSVATPERILLKSMELFAERGYDAVSVRDIARELHLNAATLYIYFDSKEALLNAIFTRLKENFIDPGFQIPPQEWFEAQEAFDPAEFLIEGAGKFFSRASRETQLTWRILMSHQYRHRPAREQLMEQILDSPRLFFQGILENMKNAGKLRPDISSESQGRMLASIFFEFSFRANLHQAWDEPHEFLFETLAADIRTFVEALRNVKG